MMVAPQRPLKNAIVWFLLAITMGMSAARAQTTPKKATSQRPTPAPAQAPIDPETTKFAKVYRSGKALQSAVTVGVNKIQFSQLVRELMTELDIVKDKPLTDHEKDINAKYLTAVYSYAKTVDCCWTVESGGSTVDIFRGMLKVCDVLMENAHRTLRGLPELPVPTANDILGPGPTAATTAASMPIVQPGPTFKSMAWNGKGRTRTATELFDVPIPEWHIRWNHKGTGQFVLQVADEKGHVVAEFRHDGDGGGLELVKATPGKFYLIPMGDAWTIATEK